MSKEPTRKELAELDAWLASGGFRRARQPKGALQRSRSQRDERKLPKPAMNRAAAKQSKSAIEILRPHGWNWSWHVSGFSTRADGASTIFGGHDLNLGLVKHDDRASVSENRKRFLAELVGQNAPPKLVGLKQVHSSVIHIVRAVPKEQLVGDGAITNVPGLLLSIQTADCVPILLVDAKQRVVGAFHAGWRGAAKRILEKGVGMMRMEYGSEPADIHAAIGPSIGSCCYAVGDEVVDEFHSQFAYAKNLFHEVYDDDPVKKKYPLLFLTARAPGHSNIGPQTHLDLVEANRRQLLDAGVPENQIWISGQCTSCNTDRFFSHRKEDGFTGRMMAVVGVKKK